MGLTPQPLLPPSQSFPLSPLPEILRSEGTQLCRDWVQPPPRTSQPAEGRGSPRGTSLSSPLVLGPLPRVLSSWPGTSALTRPIRVLRASAALGAVPRSTLQKDQAPHQGEPPLGPPRSPGGAKSQPPAISPGRFEGVGPAFLLCSSVGMKGLLGEGP